MKLDHKTLKAENVPCYRRHKFSNLTVKILKSPGEVEKKLGWNLVEKEKIPKLRGKKVCFSVLDYM